MQIKILDQEGNEQIPEVVEPKAPESIPVITGQMLTQSVGQMFDLKPTEIDEYQDKLNLLIDYAKTQTEERSPEALKWAIRSLQTRLGSPPLGEKWINYLGQYAWLKLESLKLNKEVERYDHNNGSI